MNKEGYKKDNVELIEKLGTANIDTVAPKSLSEFTIEDWRYYLKLHDGIIFNNDEINFILMALEYYEKCSLEKINYKIIGDIRSKIKASYLRRTNTEEQ